MTEDYYDYLLGTKSVPHLASLPSLGYVMSNEWIYGEYKGIVDLIDRGDKGPWALLDAEKLDDDHNTPLVQVGLTEEQFQMLNEDDEVMFKLSRADGASEAYLIYNDDTEQPYDIHLSDLKKA